MTDDTPAPRGKYRLEAGDKFRGADKIARIPVRNVTPDDGPRELARKPEWIRVKLPPGGEIDRIKGLLRKQKLHTVCEEAACPNLPECFGGGTATFMILGDICTRRCPFCDVAHGRPKPPDADEPANLADAVASLGLSYVVITSVDRDDLKDSGAQHFADCIRAVREKSPRTKIEVLVPDFRGRMDIAIDILRTQPPDVFNHNLENVPRLYREVRPGADYAYSLALLKRFKEACPDVPTKSGLMVGLGETDEEIEAVMRDLRAHDVDGITIGQYLQPSKAHAPVKRFVEPARFDAWAQYAREIGFTQVASGPLVRSSYHADLQHRGVDVGRLNPGMPGTDVPAGPGSR